MCEACPFNDGITEAACIAQNLGCLPTGMDNLNCFDQNGYSISCHEDNSRHCRGLLQERPEAARRNVLAYSKWYHNEKP
jgi:hypothetical protein